MESKAVNWPGWDVVREIGHGSFGAVYEIQRVVRGRTEHAALKVITIPTNKSEISELRAEGYDDVSITQYFADSLERIEDEYAMMADMKGHANVVYCDDLRTIPHSDGFGWDIYIKMELLTPMKDALKDAVTDEQVIRFGMDICNALVLCKQLNIVHRDIKPENIFMSRDGGFKLGDFGIAKTMEGTTGGTKTGTYDYMAPEVYNNQPYHTETDIYSLGIVLYWLLNERTIPFVTKKRPTPSEKIEARHRRFAGEAIPEPKYGSGTLKAIVLKACAYEPKDRYTDPAEMKRELEALLYGQRLGEIPESEAEQEPEPESEPIPKPIPELDPEPIDEPETDETVRENPVKYEEEKSDEAERRRKEKEDQERLKREQEECESLKREREEKKRHRQETVEAAEERARRLIKEREERNRIRREHEQPEQLRKEQEKKTSETEQQNSSSKKKTLGLIIAAASLLVVAAVGAILIPKDKTVIAESLASNASGNISDEASSGEIVDFDLTVDGVYSVGRYEVQDNKDTSAKEFIIIFDGRDISGAIDRGVWIADASQEQNIVDAVKAYVSGGLAVNTSSNIRSGPGTDYNIITTADEGTIIKTVLGKTGDWYEVLCNGHTGYIFEELVTVHNALDVTEPLTIAVSTIAYSIATLPQALIDNLQILCDENGWTLDLLAAEGDAMLQGEQISTLVSKDPDYLVIFPADPTLAIDWCAEAQEAGVPTICMHVDVDPTCKENGSCVAYCGIDNQAVATSIYNYMVEKNGVDAAMNIVEIGGVPVQADYIVRTETFNNSIAGSGYTQLGDIAWAYSSRADAQTAMESFIGSYGDQIDILVGFDDDLTMGGVNALQEAGMTDVQVYSIGGTIDAMKAIQNGELTMTVFTPAMSIAEKVVDAITVLEAGGTVGYYQYIESPIVDQSNVVQYMERAEY